PVAPPAPTVQTVSGPPPAASETAAPTVQTSRISETKPKAEIPGVNGAPLETTPGSGNSSSGGNKPFDPWTPFKPFTDAINNGIQTVTGTRTPAAGGTGSTSPTAGGSSTGASSGSDGAAG
ncbi:MAG: hypothetical protein JHC64_29025, partial [Mycolicibacterium sp.]|nr:hypothetical protein [Mycolicibacterium sp.]